MGSLNDYCFIFAFWLLQCNGLGPFYHLLPFHILLVCNINSSRCKPIDLSLSLSASVSRSLYHSPASRLNQSSPSIIIGLHNLSCCSQEHNADSNFNGATFIPVLLWITHNPTHISDICCFSLFRYIYARVCKLYVSFFWFWSLCCRHHHFLCSCVRFVWCVLLQFYWIFSRYFRCLNHM